MIFGLTNSKGGVGKTTIAVHLAAALVGKRNKVAFIDADPQQSASAWVEKLGEGIHLESQSDADELIKLIAGLKNDFDAIVIDGPAGLSEATRAIMLRADRVYLPTGPSALDFRAAVRAVQLLQEAKSTRRSSLEGFLIPNKLQKRGRLSREMMDSLGVLKIPVLKGLCQRQAFADAAGQGKVVWEMGAPALLAAHEMKQLIKEMNRG